MRIARVIGKVVLNRRMPDILPGSYLIVQPLNRQALAAAAGAAATEAAVLATDETVVLWDCLAAREGDLVGLVEGREAAVPFWPRKVPYDSYNACILDTVDFQAVL